VRRLAGHALSYYGTSRHMLKLSSGVVVVLLLFVEVAHMGAGRDSVLAVTVTWAGEVM